MPWTWEECVHCGALRGEQCLLAADGIVRTAVSQAQINYHQEKNYGDVEKDIAPLVTELVRQERIRQDKPVKDTYPPIAHFALGLGSGALCLLIAKIIQYSF